jgi:hypothetical protein
MSSHWPGAWLLSFDTLPLAHAWLLLSSITLPLIHNPLVFSPQESAPLPEVNQYFELHNEGVLL